MSSSEIITSLQKEKVLLPVSVFSHDIGPLECAVKFLKENYSLKYSEISALLSRDQRTIWISYREAKRKHPALFSEDNDGYKIEAEKLSNRNFSILEIICSTLLDKGLSITEIAGLLNKHRNTIWSVCSRFRRKNA